MITRQTILSTIIILSLSAVSVWGSPYWCPDLSGDDFVDFADFAVLAGNWMQSEDELAGDFDDSGTVDMNDLDYFVDYWLTDMDCPEYYPDQLPYMTSFEDFQGFETDVNDPCALDYQEGWEVRDGYAEIGYGWAYESPDYFYYQFVLADVNSVVAKSFTDNGDDDYVRISFIPAINQKVDVVNNSNVVASVWFASNGYIYVLDDGSYANTGVYYGDVYDSCWYYLIYTYYYDESWTSLMFKMNWSSNTYEVYWDGDLVNDIADQAEFESDYDILTDVEFVTGNDWFVLNSISISDESGSGGVINDDIYITKPCACETDEVTGRVAVTGKLWWDSLGMYEIRYCAADPAINPYDVNNWHIADVGWNVVDAGGLLGYWDTSRIPNGYYYLGFVVYNDLGYSESGGLQVLETELRYPDNTLVYSGWKHFAVTSTLKCNTFYHEEEPDISVPWPGQFPFELKLMYNNNRRYYSKPIRNGWTHNNHIILFEDSTYDWEKIDSGFWEGYPAYDENMVAFGYIWITYPDGSRKMFRHTDGSYGDGYWGDAKYYPYPENGSGEYIVRETYTDDDYFVRWIEKVEYKLYERDGTVVTFDTGNIHIEYPDLLNYGSRFGKVTAPVKQMADRFDNTLTFGWDYDKTAVTSVSDGTRTIEFDMVSGYYTEARLKVGAQTYRTIKYDWEDNNRIFTVAKSGYGVDANGIYDGGNLKEYETQYQYDDEWNLIKVVYDDDLARPSIEIEYDNYGRVEARKDFVDPNNYLTTIFEYDFYHPDPNDKEVSYLRTEATTSYRQVTTVQDDKGNLIEYKTTTFDGAPVTDVNSLYTDSSNPLKPTDVNECFDGMTRRTWNDYSSYGDLLEQRIYVDDSNYVATAFEYHPDYSLETRRTGWQDLNKTGAIVDKLSIYGDADGEEDEHGAYLVKEKILLSEDPNVWASTEYEYCDNGLVMKATDPNGFITFYEYDANDYLKLTRIGTVDSNEPVQRLYHDAIGQLCLAANSLGGVTLNDYDDFGRLWKIREYEDADAMSISDASFVPSSYEAMTPVSTVIYGYDQNGNRTYEQFAAGGEVLTEYTVSGLPSKVTYDDGSYLQNYYDSRGMKTEEYRSEASTGRDWLVEWLYDDMGRPIQAEWYDYDDANVAKAQASTYYGSGNIKNVTTYGYYSSPEKSTDYYYDILGRLTATVVAPGELNITTSYEYDAAGNRVGVIDPNGSIIYFDYDNANREIAEYFAAQVEADPNIRQEKRYYANGLVRDVNSYDYDGTLLAHSRYEYDARRRVTRVTQDVNDTEQAETFYDYSDSGFVVGSDGYQIRITDADSKETYVKLDEFGRRIKTLYPSEDYEELEYNGDGTLAARAVWDANDTKRWIEYYHDGYARLIDVNYPDGGNVHCTYDGFGTKTLVEDSRNSTENIGGSGEIAYEHDVLGRVVNITEQDGYRISYAYRGDDQKYIILVTEPNDANSIIYEVEYSYDAAGRLLYVMEPALGLMNDRIVEFGYDENGNRKKTEYFLTGNPMGAAVSIDYTHNRDNNLTGFTTTGGPTFTLSNTTIDGLGRLWDADETVTTTDGNTVDHSYTYSYDMLSRLRYAYGTNVPPTPAREYAYDYDKAGNLTHYMFNNYNPDQESHAYYSYTGDLRTGGSGGGVGWYDLNGRQTSQLDDHPNWFPFEYDWDGNLRYGQYMNPTLGMEARYDPDGVRIYKHRIWNLDSYWHKYIVDTAGDLPKILLVLDANDNNAIVKTYVHANNQILIQHDGDVNSPRYFYLHDRLGSVRQIIDSSGDVANCYYYTPWGGVTGSESDETVSNWYGWAGYLSDDEIDSYYCNARQYNAARFMTRDPVRGSFREPMTLHAYLYCLNDPVNRTDPTGEKSLSEMMAATKVWATGMAATGCNYATQAWQFVRRIASQIAVRNAVQQIATTGRKGLDFAVQMGKQGEYTVQNMLNVAKNTARYYTDGGNYRIPDFVDGPLFYESKNVSILSYTQQIKDMLNIAGPGNLIILVRQGTQTHVTESLLELEKLGRIVILRVL